MIRVVTCFFVMASLLACQNKNEGYKAYKDLEAKEIKRNVREDSLFFGIYLGMSNKDFYAHCWDMNKKGLFTNGLTNTTVLVRLDSVELGHPASMNFYPDFHNNTIARMRVSIQYDAWAPWNRQFFSDVLMVKLQDMYYKWYGRGNPFIRIDDKSRGTIFVKVDGNRRIVIGRSDDMTAKVDYTDLFAEQEMLKEKKK